jgi:hypothetical protein
MSIAFELTKAIGKKPCQPGSPRAKRCPLIINEGSEDLVTSNVFGLLKYLPASLWLFPLLEVAFRGRNFSALGRRMPKIEFWKKLPAPPADHREAAEEVDLLIRIGGMVILIECKYRSGVQGEGFPSSRRDQVARYLDAAIFNFWPDSGTPREIYFILLTDTPEEPFILSQYRSPRKVFESLSQTSPFWDYEAISHAMAGNIGWMTWRDILKILENHGGRRLTPVETMIIKDLALYLKRKVGGL